MKILIVTGGRIDPVFARDFLNSRIFDHVIVVDGALDFWDKVGATTNNKERFDHLVGDFDTISPVILDKYRGRVGLEVHAFIPEKDNTDTDIAVRLACTLAADEASEISLLGALGSRADHSLANLQLLKLKDKSYVDESTGFMDKFNILPKFISRPVLRFVCWLEKHNQQH